MTQVIDVVDMDGVTHYVLDDGRIVPANNLSPANNPSPSPAPSPMPNVANTAGQATGAYLAGKGVGSLVGGGSAGATTAGTTGGSVATPEIVSATRLPPPGMLGSAMSNFGAMGIGPQAGIVGGTLLAGKGIYDAYKGKEDNSPTGLASRLQAGITTGGLSEVGRLVGMGGKSTKDYQKERWGKLSPAAQGLYQANHPDNDTGVWQTGKYAGQKWSFDKALDLAKEDPTNFIGVLGNLETFGDRWLGVPLEKQKEVVSQLVNQGLYTSDKGDVLIKDKGKAQSIFDKVLGTSVPTQTQSGKQVDPSKVDTIFLDDNKPNGSTKRSASGMPGQLINPQTIMKSNNRSQAGKFSVPRPADIINQNSEVQDSALSPVADMETRMMQNPLINNPLFSLVRR